MGQDVRTLILALPKWVIGALAISTIIYVFSMSAVAVLTEREIKFWPPEIGPGPRQHVLSEVSEIRADVKTALQALNAQLEFLHEHLAKSRARAAESKGSLASFEWASSARSFEEDIESFDEKYRSAVKELESKIADLEERLHASNLLCQYQ
jgi:outer membrane murein-binding lipoprotein Lpp